jgi:hypothetical protein
LLASSELLGAREITAPATVASTPSLETRALQTFVRHQSRSRAPPAIA